MLERKGRIMEQPADTTRWVLIRDLLIFQLKLALDGLKSVALFQLSTVAALLDVLFFWNKSPSLFYRVLRISEHFDLWLNLYGSAADAERTADGLFGASEAGSDSLLGELEALVRERGGNRPRGDGGGSASPAGTRSRKAGVDGAPPAGWGGEMPTAASV